MSIIPNLAGRGHSLEDRADQLAQTLLAKGHPISGIVAELMALDISHQAARRIINDARETFQATRKRRAFRGVILGTAILVAGSAIAYAQNVFDIRSPYDFIGYGILAYGFFTLLINAWAYRFPAG